MILKPNEINDRIANKSYTECMFTNLKQEYSIDSEGKQFISKITKNEDREKIKSAKELFDSSDFSNSIILTALDVGAVISDGRKPLFSKKQSNNDNFLGAKELFAINKYYTDTFKNNGITVDGRELSTVDLFKETYEVSKVLKDNYAVGGALSVMQQSIVYTALEILPTEPEFHQIFTVPLQVKPGQIVSMPYVQFNSPGGLDYGSIEDLLKVQIGEDKDSFATLGGSGIAVYLTYDEMERASYDLLKLYFQAAKNALVQWKSMKAINMLHNSAVVEFDNLDPNNSIHGMTSGISLKNGGAKNMTITFRDIQKVLVGGLTRTHNYTVGIISPEAWLAIQSMPELKEFINERCLTWFPYALGAQGTLGRSGEPNWRKFKDEGTHNAQYNRLVPHFPKGFTDFQMTWIVTNHVPTFHEGDSVYRFYDLKSGNHDYYTDSDGEIVKCGVDPLSSLYFVDPSQAVAYVTEKPLSMIDKEDDFKESYTAHLKERYAFHPLRKGKAIRIIKNFAISDEVSIDPIKHVSLTLNELTTVLSK